MKESEMLVGEYYYIYEKSFWMIGMVIKRLLNRGYNQTRADIISSQGTLKLNCNWSANGRKIRLANEDEIRHLNLCIKKGKYIKYIKPQIVENYLLY